MGIPSSILIRALIIIEALLLLYKIVYAVWLWQTKEYRYDRMKAHLQQPSSWEPFLNSFVVSRVALLITLLIFSNSLEILASVGILIGVFEIGVIVWRVFRRGWLRPK